MSEVIVVTSGKGGVGKTTTAANIGTGLAALDKKVVLVDTDIGLRNLDVVLGLENRIVYNLVDVIEGNCRLKQALIKDKRYANLFLLPSAQTRDKTSVTPEQMKKLCEELKKQFDYILLDCTPSLGMLTVVAPLLWLAVRTMCEFIIISCGDTAINALAAADTTLIPVQAQYLSAKGLEQLLQTIQKVRRQINPKLKIEGILMTMTDSRTNYGREIDALIRQVYGSKIRVFEQPIPHSVRAAEISAGGRSIFAHDPKGKVAAAYQSLTREVLADAEKQRKLGAERSR